ncbi:MAG: hypothetical protein M1834_006753 [Cirrosporium novae-zelandiae]|nr:MAG: hypothetical protein M1834_006753 [Cirrosporium novae-zelandiae]
MHPTRYSEYDSDHEKENRFLGVPSKKDERSYRPRKRWAITNEYPYPEAHPEVYPEAYRDGNQYLRDVAPNKPLSNSSPLHMNEREYAIFTRQERYWNGFAIRYNNAIGYQYETRCLDQQGNAAHKKKKREMEVHEVRSNETPRISDETDPVGNENENLPEAIYRMDGPQVGCPTIPEEEDWMIEPDEEPSLGPTENTTTLKGKERAKSPSLVPSIILTPPSPPEFHVHLEDQRESALSGGYFSATDAFLEQQNLRARLPRGQLKDLFVHVHCPNNRTPDREKRLPPSPIKVYDEAFSTGKGCPPMIYETQSQQVKAFRKWAYIRDPRPPSKLEKWGEDEWWYISFKIAMKSKLKYAAPRRSIYSSDALFPCSIENYYIQEMANERAKAVGLWKRPGFYDLDPSRPAARPRHKVYCQNSRERLRDVCVRADRVETAETGDMTAETTAETTVKRMNKRKPSYRALRQMFRR